jgi:ribose/xylose/arabinose/galactoside ABC-type transport system permease subunit
VNANEQSVRASAPPGYGGWARRVLRDLAKSFADLGSLGVGLAAVLVAEIVFFSIASSHFFDTTNFENIGRAIAIIGIVAAGETVVIISGGFDLSVGSTMAAAGMIAAYLVNHGNGLVVGFGVALLAGVFIGLVNGALVSYVRINPLIATLGMLSVVRGLGFVVSSGKDVITENETFLTIGTGSVLGIPTIVVVLIVVFLAVGAVMPRTRFGRYAYAIGSNSRAATLAGVPVKRTRLQFYALCGALAAVGGVVTVARTGVGQPSANLGAELDIITAVILGGTSLNGGRGRLAGTFLGLLVLGVLNNGLILMSVPSYWQQVVKGVILLLAVTYDELRNTRREET